MFFIPGIAAILAIIFFVLLPIAGAFYIRSNWHVFRNNLVNAASLPRLTKAAAMDTGTAPFKCQAHGVIDAIGVDTSVWITVDTVSIKVCLDSVPLYILTGSTRYGRVRHKENEYSVERYTWTSLPSIPTGSSVYLAGTFAYNRGIPCFCQIDNDKLLVLLHDVPPQHVTYLGVFAGRPQNEYWNPMTKISLALGILAMTLVLLGLVSVPVISLVSALSLALAFSPVLPFLPPGLAGFLLYRRFWRRARYFRARRDVTQLRRPRDAESVSKSTKSRGVSYWKRRAFANFIASGLFFALGFVLNFLLVFILLRKVL